MQPMVDSGGIDKLYLIPQAIVLEGEKKSWLIFQKF